MMLPTPNRAGETRDINARLAKYHHPIYSPHHTHHTEILRFVKAY